MEIFKLFGSIFVDSADAEKSISKTDGLAQKLGKGLGTGIKTAAKWGAAISGAAIAGGAALFGMASKSAEATDRIDKLSQKIGMSRQGFQEWDYITSQSGMSVEQLQMGFKTLVNQVDGVTKGNKKSTATFKALGVSVYDANGAVKDQETIFNESVVALQNMEAGTEKAKLANDLFGRSGAELMPLLNGAAGSIDEMRAKAHELGIVLDDETIDAGVLFTDTMDDAKRSLGAIVTQIGANVMPVFQQALDWIIAHMPEIKAVMKVVFDAISKYVNIFIDAVKDYLIPTLKDLWAWVEPYIPQIKDMFLNAFEAMKEVLNDIIETIQEVTKWFQDHWDILGPILAGIAGGVAVFYAIQGAIALYNIVTGIATGVTTAFGAALAFITSPIGIVVIAIGALIAIGVALYKNWDTVSTFAKKLWESIKDIFTKMGNWIKDVWNSVKQTTINVWDSIKGFFNGFWEWIKGFFMKWGPLILAVIAPFLGIPLLIYQNFDKIKGWISSIWDSIKSTISAGSNAIKNIVSNVFGNLGETILKPFTWAWDKITGVLDKIKNAFSRLFPVKIPMPKFSVSGSLNPLNWIKEGGGLPKLNVAWNAEGGIFSKPTIFNTANAGLQGVGEAGPEVIAPLSKLQNLLDLDNKSDAILNEIRLLLITLIEMLKKTDIQWNERELLRLVRSLG